MITEFSKTASQTLIPNGYRCMPQFCDNIADRAEDQHLKPNVDACKTQYLAADTEELMAIAQQKMQRIGRNFIKINSRWAAIAVLAGIA